jgi:hypothetical protein
MAYLNAVNDGATKFVTVSFKDENGDAVVPNSVKWSLSDPEGSTINGRDEVSETPAEEVTVVLSGDDLMYADGGDRVLTIKAEYDSTLGNGLPIREEARFNIRDLVGV